MDTILSRLAGKGSSLAVIGVRSNFYNELKSLLQEGSERFALADLSEEEATQLMLRTRQDLGLTSLSLGSASAQSFLRSL